MNGAEPQKTNNLVQSTRMVAISARAGNESQLKEAIKAIGNAGGSFSASKSRETLGKLPTQLPHLTRKAGGQEGTPVRGITQDRPAQGHGR
jgi:hypothetical protein